jgi:hypothetical protein
MATISSEPGQAPSPDDQHATETESADETKPSQDPGTDPTAVPPKELGVMLVSAGIIGMVLPGPGTPALVAGGLILWPEAFGRVDRWLRRRFPETHRQGLSQMNRFMADLERRYPGSTR